METIPESDINYICNEILKKYEDNEVLIPYINKVINKVETFLKKKPKTEEFKRDVFIEYILNHIESQKPKVNTHVGVLAAQSIGEPVTQSALSYFHKLTGDDDSINSLKELYNITHNKMESSVIELYLKSKEYDSALKKRILNSMEYVTLNDVVLDVVYDGFILRFYLCPHTIFKIRVHPVIIFKHLKEYLNSTKNELNTWDSSVNLNKLYIEFSQPASKFLDWLDDHSVEYIVDTEMLYVFKPDLDKTNKTDQSNSNNNDGIESNSNNNDNIKNNRSTNDDIKRDNNTNSNNSNNSNINDDLNSNDKDNKDTNKSSEIDKKTLIEYFKENKLKYEEDDNYFILDSNSINLNIDDINKLLNNVVLTGTEGVVKVTPKLLKDEFVIEVTGNNLDSLFENEYVDKTRSRYTVYSNSEDVDFELRKKNILEQLERVVNTDSSAYNNQHVELLTNFMCRNGEVIPMSRFGMNSNDYSFISQLSFEDPYNAIQSVFYGIEDKLTSVSSKLITGIYQNT